MSQVSYYVHCCRIYSHVTVGMTVYLGIRDLERGKKVVDDIMQNPDPTNKAPLHLVELNLDSFESVRAAAKDFLSKEKTLNVLVNNAGGNNRFQDPTQI
jgi:NAD(P)-dependent dehydrogenase (short-subunit alcohol dehydrogenase family)